MTWEITGQTIVSNSWNQESKPQFWSIKQIKQMANEIRHLIKTPWIIKLLCNYSIGLKYCNTQGNSNQNFVIWIILLLTLKNRFIKSNHSAAMFMACPGISTQDWSYKAGPGTRSNHQLKLPEVLMRNIPSNLTKNILVFQVPLLPKSYLGMAQ